jgi:hypothetical protein
VKEGHQEQKSFKKGQAARYEAARSRPGVGLGAPDL